MIAVLWGANCHLCRFDKDKPLNKTIIKNHSDTISKNHQWYVYNNPVNGYNVSIFARFNYNDIWCLITVYLEKEDNKYAIDLNAAYDSFYPDSFEADSIYIDNPTQPDSTWFFDRNTVVTFADVNFDGEDELILCGFPRPGIDFDANIFDCEDYTVYKVKNDGFEQIRNVLFDKLHLGECRTGYIIDTTNKSITLIGYHSAYVTSKEIYWFRDGEPYKLDYIYESCYYKDSVSERPHSTYYHFNLPDDTAKYEHFEDSIYGLI